MNIDDRLRAAGKALKDGSVTQVDAASRLREIVRHADQLVAHGRLSDQPQEQTGSIGPSFPPRSAAPAAPARPRWWRPAALALLFVAGSGFGYLLPNGEAGDPGSPPPPSATVTTRAQAATPAAVPPRTKVSVPEDCLETAEWADEVIARLNRKIRDDQLIAALREYTLASEACRREASP